MPRILFFVGKGGVGKTTVSAATAWRCAQKGYKTLLMSLDAAHSLADSFDLEVALMDKHKGKAFEISPGLSIQEIDVQDAIKDNWESIYGYITRLMQTTGLGEVVAEELAIFPGMEEVVGLLYINTYAREKAYDVIILDCAPTGESLRFLSVPSALDWYMRKVFKLERWIMKLARPLLRTMATDIPLPEDNTFDSLETFFERFKGVDDLLRDSSITTVRLVTNAEKMVVKESQRAFMYFSMFGLTVDAVVINRLLPDTIQDPYMQKWKLLQQAHSEEIVSYFAPVPTFRLPLFEEEVIGLERLGVLADQLYADSDPTAILHETIPYKFVKDSENAYVAIRMPFVDIANIGLFRDEDQLVVRVANFKRHISLPRAFKGLQPVRATYKDDYLNVHFA
ncbi:MAG: ArsA family ATPase [Candidatus Sericytochromatia bacterium]